MNAIICIFYKCALKFELLITILWLTQHFNKCFFFKSQNRQPKIKVPCELGLKILLEINLYHLLEERLFYFHCVFFFLSSVLYVIYIAAGKILSVLCHYLHKCWYAMYTCVHRCLHSTRKRRCFPLCVSLQYPWLRLPGLSRCLQRTMWLFRRKWSNADIWWTSPWVILQRNTSASPSICFIAPWNHNFT